MLEYSHRGEIYMYDDVQVTTKSCLCDHSQFCFTTDLEHVPVHSCFMRYGVWAIVVKWVAVFSTD